jgi:hypothetical protein
VEALLVNIGCNNSRAINCDHLCYKSINIFNYLNQADLDVIGLLEKNIYWAEIGGTLVAEVTI